MDFRETAIKLAIDSVTPNVGGGGTVDTEMIEKALIEAYNEAIEAAAKKTDGERIFIKNHLEETTCDHGISWGHLIAGVLGHEIRALKLPTSEASK